MFRKLAFFRISINLTHVVSCCDARETMKGYTKAMKVAMLAAASAVLAAGCADSRVASKESLADALNHDYSASQDCLFTKPMPFPYQVAVNDKLRTETRHRLDALGEAGDRRSTRL